MTPLVLSVHDTCFSFSSISVATSPLNMCVFKLSVLYIVVLLSKGLHLLSTNSDSINLDVVFRTVFQNRLFMFIIHFSTLILPLLKKDYRDLPSLFLLQLPNPNFLHESSHLYWKVTSKKSN